jgi:integrase
MGVQKYVSRGCVFYKVDETITLPDGRELRLRKRRIPTKDQALAFVAKKRADAFEGRHFDVVKPCTLTVAEVWKLYEPISKRDNDTWKTDKGRAAHLIRHLGDRRVVGLGQADVDFYREERQKEKTKRKKPPTPATLDREVELLKRAINYALKCKKVPSNPIEKVALLRKPNTRRVVITEEQFQKALVVLTIRPKDNTPCRIMRKLVFRAIVTTAYDQGMRLDEILQLKRDQLSLRDGCLELGPQDTKTEEGRKVYLTRRTADAIRELSADLHGEYVFVNPRTHRPFSDIRKLWRELRTAAGLPKDAWFHDTRRSYVTNARRRKVAERVIMMQTGHKTRSTFDRYNIVDDSDQREAVRLYEAGVLRQETRQPSKS